MARRRFGIFKRASQESEESADQVPEEGTAVHPLTTATAEPDRVEETGDFAPVEETGEWEPEYQDEGTTDFEAFSEPEAQEGPADALSEPAPLPPLEPEGEVARRIRAAAEAAAQEAGSVQTDEVAVLEQRSEEADRIAASAAAEADRRVAAAERRASEAERIAHQAEQVAAAAEARASALEQRLAELEVAAEKEETGRVQGAPESADPVGEELAELRAKVEDEARSAASKWLRAQLEAAREAADARQAKAVSAARAEAEREALERVSASADGGAGLAAEAHAEEVNGLREELTRVQAKLDQAGSPHTNGNGHDPAVEEARAQARSAQERAERAERELAAAEKRAAADIDQSAEAKLNELRAELEAVRAELTETAPEAARRIEEKLVAARQAAEETLGAELRIRTAQLDREREARLLAAEAAEMRLRTVEDRAIEAAQRIAVAAATAPGTTASTATAVADPPTQVSLSEATYSELLSSGMSVGQAKRVLRRRAEQGPFSSLEELDALAEFAPRAPEELRSRLVP